MLRKTFAKLGIAFYKIRVSLICSRAYGRSKAPVVGDLIALVKLMFHFTKGRNLKAQKPEYLAIEGNEVPYKALPEGKGWIKVIAGSYEELSSVIPNYSEQFLYHIHLEPHAFFSIDLADNLEVAAYLPESPGIINDESFHAGDFVEFDRKNGIIEIRNENPKACDYLLFGGERYLEPIIAEGPFVMNSKLEIANAYKDFYNGNYGQIDYEKQRSKITQYRV